MKQIFLLLFLVACSVYTRGQSVPSYVPASGLLAWYPFSGNANDNSGHGHDGTDSGAVLTDDRFGDPFSAYYFNGRSAIKTSFVPPTGNSARTISCWFKYDTLPDPCGDRSMVIVGYGGDTRSCSEADKNFSLEVVYGPPQVRVDGICINNQESVDTVDNRWHFFAAVYDTSFGDFTNIKLYVDGAYKTSATSVYGGITSVITDSLTKLAIGAGHYDCQRYFIGKIDDIGVWNRALSGAELSTLYHGDPTASSDSFVVYTTPSCGSLHFSALTHNYSHGQHIITYLSNGTIIDSTVTPSGMAGICNFSQAISYSGTYTIKHVLYDGAFPVDSITYSFIYHQCSSILVNYFNDANHNCIFDTSSEALIAMPVTTEVDSNGISIDTIPSAGGFYYSALGNIGDIYRFKALTYPASLIPSCAGYGIAIDTLHGLGSMLSNYIGLACDTTAVYDLSVNAIISATGTNDQSGNIYIQNTGNCAPIDVIARLTFTPKYIPFDAQDGGIYNMVPPPTTIGVNDVTWSLPALSIPGGLPVHLWYAIYHSPSLGYLTVRDTVHTYYTVSPTTGDIDTSNNQVIIVDTVKTGVDPNEMWVSPAGCIPYTPATTKLQYTIMFENTGNDTAYNIYVLDTLSPAVDPSTIRFVMVSANMIFSRFTDSFGHHILKFDFPGINLFDSSHHSKCTDAIIFTVNTLPGLPLNNVINNEAGIYFDYNTVVMTNAVQNMIGCTEAVTKQSITASADVFPNPAHDKLILKADPAIYSSFSITNAIGQTFLSQPVTTSNTNIDIRPLPSGLYYLTLISNNTIRTVKKFIKD